MKEFKYYKQLIGAIILAGIMIMMALRISDIASGLDAIFTAFVPLIVGACIAFVLDILVVRYERWLWPKCGSGWKYKIRRPLSLLLSFVTISVIVYFIARLHHRNCIRISKHGCNILQKPFQWRRIKRL